MSEKTTESETYDPRGLISKKVKYGNNNGYFTQDDDPLESKDRGDFHIGQSYEDKACDTIVCKVCGGDRFIVGSGSYYTALKCPNCEYEVCFHVG